MSFSEKVLARFSIVPLERDSSSAKYIPLLNNIEPDLAAKLDALSSRGDQKLPKSWNKLGRPVKQSSLPPTGQGKRRQSAGLKKKPKT